MTYSGTTAPHRKPHRNVGLRHFLKNRRQRFASRHPQIGWKGWVLTALPLAGLAAATVDRPLTLMLRQQPESLRALAAATTDIGTSGWILGTALAVAGGATFITRKAARRARRVAARRISLAATYVFASVALSGIAANLLKRAIGRARPIYLDDLGPYSFHPFSHNSRFESFPSGHATTDGALFMALALLFPALRWPLLVLGALAAFTRVLVAAHYPSDVIAGYVFGIWFALLIAILFARAGLIFRGGSPGKPAPGLAFRG